MPVPTHTRIQIVLLMAIFESPAIMRQKLHVEFGRSTPIEGCIATTFQHFCETSTVENKERSRRPPTITEAKVQRTKCNWSKNFIKIYKMHIDMYMILIPC
jgi:hypothetical protein